MSKITNDAEFKLALQKLDYTQQRIVAALLVEHVVSLCKDDRIKRVIKLAADSNASAGDLSMALKSAKAATIDCHTRCGSEGNWTDQAGYFVARAAVATVTPKTQSHAAGPAWQAAMNCRMAQTSMMIDTDKAESASNEWQYDILSNYLNS